MLKVAVLGAGFMGGTHARAFAKLPAAQVVGVSSRSADKAEALAAEVGAQPYTDSMALATSPLVDAVSVTLPTNLHKEAVVAALQAGKHVFVEKPMGLSVAECALAVGFDDPFYFSRVFKQIYTIPPSQVASHK